MDLNSFHPERVVFMRKEILLPAVAVAGGGAGFVLRRWELATAFEADTGLPIPGTPATLALIALSVAMAAVLALLCRGKYPSFTGYDEAFQAKGNTLYATAMVLSAFLLLGAAVLMVLSFVQGTNTVYTRLLLAALAAGDLAGVARRMYNVFEDVLPERRGAEVQRIKNALVQQGALGASMSGTGSTVFGLFDREEAARRAYELLQESYRDTFLARSLEKMV